MNVRPNSTPAAQAEAEAFDAERSAAAAAVLFAQVEIKQRESTESAIKLGQALRQAKPRLKHGEWLPYLERCNIPKRTAQRLMKLAQLLDWGYKCDHWTHLGWRQLLAELKRQDETFFRFAKASGAIMRWDWNDSAAIRQRFADDPQLPLDIDWLLVRSCETHPLPDDADDAAREQASLGDWAAFQESCAA